MSITQVGAVEKVAAGVTSTTLAASPNPTAGNLIVLHHVMFDSGGPTINTPTAASHTFTACKVQRTMAAETGIRSYYEAACPGGAVTVTFSSGSGTSDHYVMVTEYSITGAAPLDQVTGSGGSGTGTSASATTATTTQANEIIIGLVTSQNTSGSITPAQTQIHEDEGFNGAASYQLVSATGTHTNTWTVPSGAWICDVYAFKDDDPGGAATAVRDIIGVGVVPFAR